MKLIAEIAAWTILGFMILLPILLIHAAAPINHNDPIEGPNLEDL